jgi:hypothetical protein
MTTRRPVWKASLTTRADTVGLAESRDQIAAYTRAVASLTPVEREALTMMLNGEPYAHVKALDNGLQRARHKLRAAA